MPPHDVDRSDSPPPDDEPTTAERIAAAGSEPKPGHPAERSGPSPSPGEQLGRGADELAVPGDDSLSQTPADDEMPPG